jgi:hypothetical protein
MILPTSLFESVHAKFAYRNIFIAKYWNRA